MGSVHRSSMTCVNVTKKVKKNTFTLFKSYNYLKMKLKILLRHTKASILGMYVKIIQCMIFHKSCCNWYNKLGHHAKNEFFYTPDKIGHYSPISGPNYSNKVPIESLIQQA